MSIWLKRRVVTWCALMVLVGGGCWLSSVWAQDEVSPPAKTAEAAAATFMALLANVANGGGANSGTNVEFMDATGKLLVQTISRVQIQKIEKHNSYGSGSSIENLLWDMVVMQRNQDYKGKIMEQTGDKAVVELQKTEPSALPPIVCVAEDGGWRVDLFDTYAKWRGLSDLDRDILTAKLTGEVSPQLAGNPEIMSAFNKAREDKRRSSCQSNLKQVSLGMMQYIQDYDEKLPPARDWAEVLQLYVKSQEIFRCPSVPDQKGFGYAFNSRLSKKDYNAIPQTAQLVWIYETTDLRWNAYGLGEKPAFRHLEGANYAFADGHVKWYEKTHIPQFTFQP